MCTGRGTRLDRAQHQIFRRGCQERDIIRGECGAASIGLHLLSPLSWDKFDRAILQSGSANMPWATLSLLEARRRSIELARDYIKCDETDEIQQIIDCLRATPAKQLVEEQWVSRYILQFPFLPVVDGKFLFEDPEAALRKGRFKNCPILVGSNLNEGMLRVLLLCDRKSVFISTIRSRASCHVGYVELPMTTDLIGVVKYGGEICSPLVWRFLLVGSPHRDPRVNANSLTWPSFSFYFIRFPLTFSGLKFMSDWTSKRFSHSVNGVLDVWSG